MFPSQTRDGFELMSACAPTGSGRRFCSARVRTHHWLACSRELEPGRTAGPKILRAAGVMALAAGAEVLGNFARRQLRAGRREPRFGAGE